MNGASIAATTTSSSRTIPKIATGLATKSRAMRASGVSELAGIGNGASMTVSGSVLIPSVSSVQRAERGVRVSAWKDSRGAGPRGSWLRPPRSSFRLRQPHARIERRVQNVDDQIDEDEHRDNDQQVRDDHGPIEHVDRIDQKLTHSRPRENALGHDRERDQRAELQAHDSDDRNQNVAQHVHADDAPIGESLRA